MLGCVCPARLLVHLPQPTTQMEVECAGLLAEDEATNEAAMSYQFASDYYKKAGWFTQTIIMLTRCADLLVDAEE